MKAIILAGGSGTRLWPLSREQYPKQLLNVLAGRSFLQQTFLRLARTIAPADIFVITGYTNYHDVVHQLDEIAPGAGGRVLMEPLPRNTAPAIALGLKCMEEEGRVKGGDVLFVCPSDHMIPDHDAFASCLRQGERLAAQGYLVAFGIAPDKPETGYGYIRRGEALKPCGYAAAAFVEKPSAALAEQYVASGDYLWNGGMIAASADTLWAELANYAGDIARVREGTGRDAVRRFSSLPSISFDYAVMERSERVAVIPMNLAWSDIGSWDSVYDVLDKDDQGNVAMGDTVAVDSNDNLIIGDSRLVAAVGCHNMIIVDTKDALMVAQRGASQQVKEVVNKLKAAQRGEAIKPPTRHRPWGSFTILEKTDAFQIRRLSVRPRACIAPQLHKNRSEHWIVLKGEGTARIGDIIKDLAPGKSAYIPANTRHQMENTSDSPLEVIEVQVGSPIDDTDIVRFDHFDAVEPMEDARDAIWA